jgi:glyoxylase-like metal-dependent hydrolase (beta-lactamase superfamily II)
VSVPVSIAGARGTHEFLTYVTVLETGGPGSGSGLVAFDSGLEAGNGLRGAFLSRGLDPLAVTHVFHTHIHIDHFGGDRLFSRALKVMSREELSYQRRWSEEFHAARDKAAFIEACHPHLSRGQGARLADMLGAAQPGRFAEESLGDPCLFRFFEDVPGFSRRGGVGETPGPGLSARGGAGGLLPSGFFDFVGAIPTPGHTPHHLSFAVLGRDGAAIVTGDLFPAKSNFYGGVNGFVEVTTDREEAARSRALVARVGEAHGDAAICPAHDRPFRFRSGGYLRENPWSVDR